MSFRIVGSPTPRGGKVSAESSEYLRCQVSKSVAAKPRQYISVPEVGVASFNGYERPGWDTWCP